MSFKRRISAISACSVLAVLLAGGALRCGAALAQMNRTSTAEVALDYQGPCPDGWAGGDVEMPGVGRISTGAMMKAAPGAPPK